MTGKRGVLCWVLVVLIAGCVGAQAQKGCERSGYRAVEGITAESNANGVTLTWTGEANEQLRAKFALRDGQPVVQELAARRPAAPGWCWARI